jgi:thiol:disulfide interchange protein
MTFFSYLIAATAVLSAIICGPAAAQTPPPPLTHPAYAPITEFDPARDAAADLQEALAEAKRTSRNVLLDVGGKWCIWCRIMDDFFEANLALAQLREANYVTVKINFSPENKNETLLSKYPNIPGYPHLFVLDADGKLLHSQSTAELEAGKSYNLEKFTAFLKQWSPVGIAK